MLPFRIGNRRGPLKSGRRTAAEGTEIFFPFNNERTGEFVTGNPQKVAQSFWEHSTESAENQLPKEESTKGGENVFSALCGKGNSGGYTEIGCYTEKDYEKF